MESTEIDEFLVSDGPFVGTIWRLTERTATEDGLCEIFVAKLSGGNPIK